MTVGIKTTTEVGQPSLTQNVVARLKPTEFQNCSHCFYYVPNAEEKDLRARNAKSGFCLRYPPTHGFHVVDAARGALLEKSSFPHVNMMNICGEFLKAQ